MKIKEIYQKKIIPYFKKKYHYQNKMAIPAIYKIIVNVGVGKNVSADPKFLEIALKEISQITGQKPKITKSSRAISGFNLKIGAPVGLVVTLRKKRMEEFLEKLINIVLPRIRDFRGLKLKAIDKSGNLNIGIVEHTVFPEVKQDQVVKPVSLQINIVSSVANVNEAKDLYEQYGFIFSQNWEGEELKWQKNH